ncbi:hypothetical protein NX059_011713 [Plenodomus lindquistii]|nr:hypothetical protein NX059_011713 [Plenodomus lindquistii]
MLRSMAVSHNRDESIRASDKHAEAVSTVAADEHERHHEKTSKSDFDGGPSAPSERGEFQRYINELAINNFGLTLQVGWETVGLSFQLAWLNGGPAALVYGSIIAGIGSTLVATALGEMASM